MPGSWPGVSVDLHLSIPQREHALLAGILVDAVTNQAFLAGFLDGLGASTVTAVLAPRPGACCVELRAAMPGR